MGYDHDSHGIEGQGQRSKYESQFEMRSAGPQSSTEASFLVVGLQVHLNQYKNG